MANLATYSPENINILLAGVLHIDGLADGTFVTISKEFPLFSTDETADGMVTRSHSPSQLYTVRLTLASTSDSNQYLTYLYQADAISLMGKFPTLIKDTLGSTLLFSSSSWIETLPDTDYATSVGERQWTIRCANAVLNVGGNYSASSAGQDLVNTALGVVGGLL